MRAWIPPGGRSDIASLLAVEPLDARPVASCFSTCYLIQRYICPRLRRVGPLRGGRCYAGLSCGYKGKAADHASGSSSARRENASAMLRTTKHTKSAGTHKHAAQKT